jgi:hypothetical protein
VAQDQDLQVLGGIAAGEQHEHLNGAAQREVGESRQHQSDLAVGWLKRHATEPRPARTGSSQPTSEFTYPTPCWHPQAFLAPQPLDGLAVDRPTLLA